MVNLVSSVLQTLIILATVVTSAIVLYNKIRGQLNRIQQDVLGGRVSLSSAPDKESTVESNIPSPFSPVTYLVVSSTLEECHTWRKQNSLSRNSVVFVSDASTLVGYEKGTPIVFLGKWHARQDANELWDMASRFRFETTEE